MKNHPILIHHRLFSFLFLERLSAVLNVDVWLNPSEKKKKSVSWGGRWRLSVLHPHSDWVSVAGLKISPQETGSDGQKCSLSPGICVPKRFILCLQLPQDCRCWWQGPGVTDENTHTCRMWGEWSMSGKRSVRALVVQETGTIVLELILGSLKWLKRIRLRNPDAAGAMFWNRL